MVSNIFHKLSFIIVAQSEQLCYAMIITDNEVSVVRRDAVAANSEQRSAFEWPIGKRMESGNVELLLVFLVVIHLVNGGKRKGKGKW